MISVYLLLDHCRRECNLIIMGKDVGFCMVSSAYCAMRSFSVNSLIRFPKLGMAENRRTKQAQKICFPYGVSWFPLGVLCSKALNVHSKALNVHSKSLNVHSKTWNSKLQVKRQINL